MRSGLSTTNASNPAIQSKAIASMKTGGEHTRSSCFPLSSAIRIIGMVIALLQFNRKCANQMNQCPKNSALLRAPETTVHGAPAKILQRR